MSHALWQRPYLPHRRPPTVFAPRLTNAARRRFFWLAYFVFQSTLISIFTYPFLTWKPTLFLKAR